MAGDAFLSNGFYNKSDERPSSKFLKRTYTDTPSATVDFLSTYQGMNDIAQRKYESAGKDIADRYSGFRGGNVDLEALQSRIDNTSLRFQDLGTIQEVKTYGDRAAKSNYPRFEFGDPIEEINSNAGKIAKDYKKELK